MGDSAKSLCAYDVPEPSNKLDLAEPSSSVYNPREASGMRFAALLSIAKPLYFFS